MGKPADGFAEGRRNAWPLAAQALAMGGALAMAVAAPASAANEPTPPYWKHQWHLTALDLAGAHQLAPCHGQGVKVGVLDTGVDGTHPDLAGQVLPGRDLVEPSNTGARAGWKDVAGHGTGVAGVIAATNKGFSGNGVKGVAPKVQIVPVRYSILGTGDAGNTKDKYATVAQTIDALKWMADQGVKIINISFGLPNDLDLHFAIRDLKARGVIFVVAAGNKSNQNLPGSEGAWASLLVGSSNQSGQKDAGSVGGFGGGPDNKWAIDVLAPGKDILTTSTQHRHRLASGTSYASPMVAGLAALVWCQFPNLSADELLWRLTSTATDAGPSGPDVDNGTGVINPVAALAAQVSPSPPPGGPSSSAKASVPASAPPSAPAAGQDGAGGWVLVVGLGLAAALAGCGMLAWLLTRRKKAPLEPELEDWPWPTDAGPGPRPPAPPQGP